MALQPNLYFGKLVDAHLGAIGQAETPAMVLIFDLTHAATASEWAALSQPVRREVKLWLSQNAKEKTFADLRAIGFNGDWDAPKFAADLYEGAELDVTNEVYQGKTQDVVRLRKLAPAANNKPVAADLKRTLAAQFKTSSGAAAKPSTPPPSRPAAAAESDPPPF
jgi:hypothetical protein